MGYKSYCIVSGIFFCLVALAHAMRVVYGLEVAVEGHPVPMYLSWIAVVGPLLLASWAFRVAGNTGT